MKKRLQIISGSLILLSSICFSIIYLNFDDKLRLKNEEIESKRMIEGAVSHNLREARAYSLVIKNTEEHIKVLKALNKFELVSKLEKDVKDNLAIRLEFVFSSANALKGNSITQDEVKKKSDLIYSHSHNKSRKEIEEASQKLLVDSKEGFNKIEKEIVETKILISSLESQKNFFYIIAFFLQAVGMLAAIISGNHENKTHKNVS